MVGGGKSFSITDSWESALAVRLSNSDDITVHAYTGDERQLPLIWESRYGSGKFVLDNFGLYTKEVRGLYAASYSLLNPVTVYPVINASCFTWTIFPPRSLQAAMNTSGVITAPPSGILCEYLVAGYDESGGSIRAEIYRSCYPVL